MASSLTRRRVRQRQETRARQSKRLTRAAAFGAIVLIVIVSAGYFLLPVLTPKPSGVIESVSGKVVNIQAAMDGFDLKEIRAKVGETLTVNLRSLDTSNHTDGGGKHQFQIEELGVNIITEPLSVNSGTFTVTKPGTYTYYCGICCGGKANPTMNGELIVES